VGAFGAGQSMNDGRRLTPVREEDYELIEQAVMETARGRWFLAEYARRNRAADTRVLLDAIKRLERVVSAQAVEFVPTLESSQAVGKVRELMQEAVADVTAMLASTGHDTDSGEARRDPTQVLESRLRRQSTILDELILNLRSAHNAIAVEQTASEPRRRLAQAIDKLAELSKTHYSVSQAIRRGISFFRTLEQALGEAAPKPEPESAPHSDQSTELPSTPSAAMPPLGEAEAGDAQARATEPPTTSATSETEAKQSRIVIVRKPSSALSPLPDFSEDEEANEDPTRQSAQ